MPATIRLGLLAMSIAGLHSLGLSPGQDAGVRTLTFGADWRDRWTEVSLDARATEYTSVADSGVLRARSDRSASAIWHPLDDVGFDEDAAIRWRWRVTAPVAGNADERAKAGDDYAARVFVVFEGAPFESGSRALCYVWSAREPVGSVYRNPYVENVATIVVESGSARAGGWVSVERRFVQDFIDAFGRRPDSVTAVALMVDTDDTGAETTTWFGRVEVLR